MAQYGRFYLPPFSAVVNVVRESAKSLVPEDSPCLEILRKATGAEKVPTQNENPEQTRVAQNRKSQSGYSGIFESNASYDEIEGENRPNKVEYDGQTYQRSGPQKFSIAPGSFEESEDFGDSEGGEYKTRHKINEWQAAWNVTNAIQVS